MTEEITGIVFNIQRYCTDDGPGIRTTVFLKGCPLRCQWCHNPEGLDQTPELSCDVSQCKGCGICSERCPEHLHVISENVHLFEREKCKACGICAEACPFGALTLEGKRMRVRKVMEIVVRDKVFYKNSGGGLTLSGGEPLFQPEFSKAILSEAKAEGIQTCLETCGFASSQAVEGILPFTGLVLFDIKETDRQKHLEYTGADNSVILQNLYKFDEAGKPIILRCPVIPGKNNRPEHFEAVAELANSLKNVIGIELEPYHPLGLRKYDSLGKQAKYNNAAFLERSAVTGYTEKMKARTSVRITVK